MLVVNQAHKSFGSLNILNNVNLMVKAQTILGLAGPSGGGEIDLTQMYSTVRNFRCGLYYL